MCTKVSKPGKKLLLLGGYIPRSIHIKVNNLPM